MSHRVSTTARAIKDVLAVFSEIAGLIPIVGLDKIAKGILLVWEAVEQTKINSHLLRRLAERTTTFLATLEAQITQCSPAVVLKLESSIRGLNERLEKILEHIKLTSQSSIKQYLHRNDIRDSVVEYSAVLQDAVLLLGAQTQIVLMDWISQNDEDRRKEALASRELLEQIKKQLDDTNESVTALPDMVRGMFMDEVFDDGALAESPLALSDIVLGNPNTAGFAAATLDVTVKHFPATTPAQVYHYLQTVKTWSRFRHLNVLRVLWHSSLDAKPSPFIVVPKMETATLDNYLNQEWGRYSHPDIGTGIVSGLTYLRSRGLHITTLPASHIALNGHRPIIHGLDSQELNTSRNVMSKVFIADGILSVNRLDSIASEHFLDASFAYTEGDRSLGRLSTHFRPVSDGQDLSLPPDWKGLASEYSDDVDSALCILRIVIKHISIKARVDINLSLSMDELATSSVIQQVIRCLRNSAHTTKIYALRVIDSVANTQFRAQALIQMRVISHLRSLFSTPHSFTWGQVCWTVYRILDNYGEDYDPAEVLEEDLVLLQSFLKRKENAWSRATSMALLLSIWRRRGVSCEDTCIREEINKNIFPPLNKWLAGNDTLMAHNAFLGLKKLLELLRAQNAPIPGADPFASSIRWLSRGCDSGMLECILRCLNLMFKFPYLLSASSQSTLKALRTALTGTSQDESINARIRAAVDQQLTTVGAHIIEETDVEELLDSEGECER